MNKKGRGSWVVQWIGIGISIACIVFMVKQVDMDALGSALINVDRGWLLIALVSLSIGYTLRIVRWGVMLRAAGATVRNTGCAGPFMGSIALNNVLPLRAGDIVRAFIFPASMGVRRATSTASLFLERLLDLLTLLLCLAISIYFSVHVSLPVAITTGVFSLSLFVFCAFLGMFLFDSALLRFFMRCSAWSSQQGYHRLSSLLAFMGELFKRLTEMLNFSRLVGVLLLSCCVWIFEAGVFLSLLKGLHLSVGIMDGMGIMAITTLATLVPSSPGYVGPFHVVAYSALVAIGVSLSDAASFAILTHLTLWLPTTLVGAFAIMCHRQLFQGISLQEQEAA